MRKLSSCIKICEMCGKPFETKSRTKRFCNRPHYATCCICGKEFEIPNNNVAYYFDRLDHVTCSSACRSVYANRNLKPGERAQKMKEAMQRKYGVDNPGQLQSCIEKRERTNIIRYGDKAPINNPEIQARMKATCLEKYGTEFVTQSQEFKNKARATCLGKYGVESYLQTEEFQEKSRAKMLEKFGVEHALQSPEIQENRRQTYRETWGADHPMLTHKGIALMKDGIAKRHDGDDKFNNTEKARQTCLERYGVEFYVQTEEYKQKTRATNLSKRGVEHHLRSPEVIEKRRQTCLEKYGSDNVFSSEYGMQKIRESMLRKYGVINPSQHPEFKHKATKSARNSKLELRIFDLLVNYNIEFQHHYMICNDGLSHEFDFYIPKYKLLIDADGLYYHAYLNDPNGKQSLDYYDDIRLKLVPKDHQFHVIIEGNEDSQVKQIVDILKQLDAGIFDYDSYLFDWCRSIEFPYPNYTEKRLIQDWSSLCKYTNDKYSPTCRIGESIIKQYHPSIFNCRVGNNSTPLEAWYDDAKLKKVIKNRLIYVNNVDPSKILRGFNISKICPVVSMFNPILAKYLTQKYLSEFDSVFDPFSGFSGRLLGVSAAGKQYIGQDLNPVAVRESNQIISFLNLQNKTEIKENDLFNSQGKYECLLTCPPYGRKEIYNQETVFQSCDAWISECLKRFDCKRYVFVVDETEEYSKHITETLKASSHFAKIQEQVIVIDK